MSKESYGVMRRRIKPKNSEKNLSQCQFTHHEGANPGLCGKRPATNDLSHGTAFTHLNLVTYHNQGRCSMYVATWHTWRSDKCAESVEWKAKELNLKTRREYEDNIKIDLDRIEWSSENWIYLVQDR
jgi:hypothetical protein